MSQSKYIENIKSKVQKKIDKLRDDAQTEYLNWADTGYQRYLKKKERLEMCREKHLSRMELNGGYDAVNGCYVQPNYWVLPKVFQFPKEEEVEQCDTQPTTAEKQ